MYEYEDALAEYDEFDEFDENSRRPRNRFRPLPVPRRGGVTPTPQAPGRPVTHADLANATRRLDDKIGVNARAIKTIEGRVNSVAAENARQTKQMESVRNDLKSLREVSTLLPLLTTQKTATVEGTEVLVPTNDTFSKLLPILMLSGGLGGSSSASASGGASSDGGLGGIGLPLLLVLATQK